MKAEQMRDPAVPTATGDDSWLASVYVRERDQLFRTARLLLGSDVLAEEVVQEAFLRAHEIASSPERPGAYLQVVVLNLCRNQARRRALERRQPLPVATVLYPSELDETWEAVCRLPFLQRAVLVLRFYADLPESEIAEVLACPVGTVKSRLHRGLAKLRKELLAND